MHLFWELIQVFRHLSPNHLCYFSSSIECFLLSLQFQLNQDKMNFSTLRNIQGLHAPLKLQMEYRAARQVYTTYLTHNSISLIFIENKEQCLQLQ